MNKHPLYDVAVAEVRGQADAEDKAKLSSNVFEWRDALQSVVDEVASQLEYKTEEYKANLLWMEESGDEEGIEDARRTLDVWGSRARVFKKHVSARLLAVKRMCDDQEERFNEVEPNLEAALAVTAAAVDLIEAERVGEDEFDEAFDELLIRVGRYQDQLR